MTEKSRTQSPIFVKTYDFLLWLLPLTIKFPKSQRFLLAEKIGKLALEFYDVILEAAVTRPVSMDFIPQADLLLNKLRLYLRLSYDLHCISISQYEFASKSMDEIGRLLGGWKAKISKHLV